MGEGQGISCHLANVLKIRRNPHLLRFMLFQQPINYNMILLCHLFVLIFCQPAIRLNRSYCPPNAVQWPASEQTIISHFQCRRQPTLATLWEETPQIPQQLSVNTRMSTFSLIALLSGMNCNIELSHFKHGLSTKYILFHRKSGRFALVHVLNAGIWSGQQVISVEHWLNTRCWEDCSGPRHKYWSWFPNCFWVTKKYRRWSCC